MNPASKIIEHPEKQSPLHRTFWGAVTAAFWAFYVYLLLPLATLLLWVMGVRNAYTELYMRRHAVDPVLLLMLPALALVCVATVIAWAEYNRHRFQGHDRRRHQPDVPRSEIAAALSASPALEREIADVKIALLQMDAKARPTSLEPGRTGPVAIS